MGDWQFALGVNQKQQAEAQPILQEDSTEPNNVEGAKSDEKDIVI